MKKSLVVTALSVIFLSTFSCVTSFDSKNKDIYPDSFEMVSQTGHAMQIDVVSFSPDGQYFATGSMDKSIALWRMSDGMLIRRFTEFNEGVHALTFSPDGQAIALSNGFHVLIVNVVNGTVTRKISCGDEFIKHSKIEWSTDGKKIVLGRGFEGSGSIRLFNANNGRLIWTKQYSSEINTVSISPDSSFIASGSDSGYLSIFDTETGKVIWKNNIGVSILSSDISFDGKLIAVSNQNWDVTIFNTETQEQIYSFKSELGQVNSMKFNKNGSLLLVGGDTRMPGRGDWTGTGFVSIWDIEKKDWQLTMPNYHTAPVNSVDWSPLESSLVSVSGLWDEGEIFLWNPNGTLQRNLTSPHFMMQNVVFSNDGSFIMSGGHHGKGATGGSDGIVNYIGLNDLQTKSFNTGLITGVLDIKISNDDTYYATGHRDSQSPQSWEIANGKKIEKPERGGSGWSHAIAVSPDGKYIATGVISSTSSVTIRNAEDYKVINYFNVTGKALRGLDFSPDSSLIAASFDGEGSGQINVWDVVSGEETLVIENIDDLMNNVRFSPDGKYLISAGKGRIWNASTGRKVRDLGEDYYLFYCIEISPDGKYLVTGDFFNKVILWSFSSGKKIKEFRGHEALVNSVVFSPDGKYIASTADDGTTRIWNIETEESIAILSTGTEWIIYTPDGYFDASANGGHLLSMAKGLEAFGVDQFALKYNRPDIILKRMGFSDSETINYFHNLYLKRLVKAGIIEDQLSSELHTPSAKIIDSIHEGKSLILNISLADDLYNLKKYNIYINDVPLYGAHGIEITGQNFNFSKEIELNSGQNKIEVSCMNEKGAESYRPVTFVEYKGKVSRDLYFIGFGISDYMDDSLDLKYAAKDVQDLADVLKKMEGVQFNSVYTNLFINEDVTIENIIEAKELLVEASVDDTFILLVSGHGIHDSDPDATYYFLTHNAEIDNIAGTCADFELIEDLLQGIPPRNKLFLMDTCESGEVETGIETEFITMADSKGFFPRTVRGLKTKKDDTELVESKPRTFIFNNNRFIHNDLFRRSGAIVFSSSKGGEFSYEDETIENGFFTEQIINCFSDSQSDVDKDGYISTDELRIYVSKLVSEKTYGMQNPTVDRDNIFQKFGFSIIGE